MMRKKYKKTNTKQPSLILKLRVFLRYEELKQLNDHKGIDKLRRLWRQKKWKALEKVLKLCLISFFFTGTLWAGTSEATEPIRFGTRVTLEEAIRKTFQSNQTVLRARERLEKEHDLYRGRKSEFFPRFKTEIFEAVSSGEKNFLSYFDTALEQPLFEGGRQVALKKKQKARLESEEFRLVQDKLKLELRLRILYVEALREKELIRLAQGSVQELTRWHDKMKSLLAQELITKQDYLRSEALLLKMKHSLVEHKETHDYLVSVLKDTVGLNEGESLELEPLGRIPKLQDDAAYYLDAFRGKDPIFKLKTLEVKEKTFEKKALEAGRYPEFSLTARYNVNQDVFVDTNRMMFGVMGKWNIWDFGRLSSEIKAKTHEIEEARLSGLIEIEEREQEIKKLFHAARSRREKIRLEEANLEEKEEAYKNEKAKLVAGEKSSGEVIDAFILLQEATAEKIKTISEYRLIFESLSKSDNFLALTGAKSEVDV